MTVLVSVSAEAARPHAQVKQLAPLRPLLLLLKAFLKQQGLNVVHRGGLSSFSLLNMVRAPGVFGLHLQLAAASLTTPWSMSDPGSMVCVAMAHSEWNADTQLSALH